MNERTDLKGRVALVTGSSSGIGAAVAARSPSSAPASSSTRRRRWRRQQVAGDLPGAIYVQADVADPTQARLLVDATVGHYGRLDIVVNNAGTTAVIPHDDLDAATPEVWEKILRVNVIGPWNVVRAAAPHLRASGDGVILNMTSLAGVRRRLVHPVCRVEGGTQPPDGPARQRPRSRGPRPCRGAGAHRHAVDRRLGRGASRGSNGHRSSAAAPRTTSPTCVGLISARYATGQVLVVDGGVWLR